MKIIGLEHNCDPCFIICSKVAAFGSMRVTHVEYCLVGCNVVKANRGSPV
jgi:hypothetical protein